MADQLSQANGRRTHRGAPLILHMLPQEFAPLAMEAPTAAERRGWAVLREITRQPFAGAVVKALGVRDDLVLRTVRAYNARSVAGVVSPRRGSVVETRHLLTLAQGAELQAALAQAPMTNDELAGWIEARCGRRSDATTLWIYQLGVASHSVEGRRAAYRCQPAEAMSV